jgi:glycosyltransferase involved in cell wall biosynthesis
MPSVSILVPVFNRKNYIDECIQSALRQTFTDLEVIIVDNASDDGTWEICKKLSEKDARIKLYRNIENIGPVRNWIKCAEKASGKFCKILFSDDTLEPECLAEMVPKLEREDVSLVFCAAKIGGSKETGTLAYSHEKKEILSSGQFLRYVINGRAPVSPGATLVRTKDLLKNLHVDFPTALPRPFGKHGAGPDVLISLLTSDCYPLVAHCARPLVFFRAHGGSFTMNDSDMHIFDGYTSAIGYYLSAGKWKGEHTGYIAKRWLHKMKGTRSLVNPATYALNHNGSGQFHEAILMVIYAITHVLKRMLRPGWLLKS